MDGKEGLRAWGLNENEAGVYLACLRLGTASVYEIAQTAMLAKSTAYDVLKSLRGKGFVSEIRKGRIKQYEAAPPAVMLEKLEEKRRAVARAIPALERARHSLPERPGVTVFTGVEGVKTVLQDALDSAATLRLIGDFGEFKEYLKGYSRLFVEKRISQGMHCKLLEPRTPRNERLKSADAEEFRETRFISGLKNARAECYLYGSTIALLTLEREEPVGIIIENECLSRFLVALFENLWEKAEH